MFDLVIFIWYIICIKYYSFYFVEKNMLCIALHTYGKNKTEELTENEKNSLKKLLDYYKESIEGEENNE